MKIYFYQANFCAECGNEMKPRFSWGPRYFCDDCATQMGRGSYVKSILGLVLGTTLIVSALNRSDPPMSVSQSNAPASGSAVSARDATAVQNPIAMRSEIATPVMCGAKTKKGTPCKRSALAGRRCAQHRGRPSMLDNSQPMFHQKNQLR